MKKRASLLRFAASLAGVVSIGIWGLSIVGHNQTKYAPLGAGPSHASKPSAQQIGAQYGRLPLSFRANQGQTAPEVQFLSQGAGYELFLTRQDAVLALQSGGSVRASRLNRASDVKALRDARRTQKTSLLRLRFDGANSAAEVRGVDRLPGRTDYFIGNDPKNWRTEVPSYSRVAYQGIYSGVDAVFYGNQRQLEYDFIVAPGADANQIALDVEGAKTLKLDAKGNLVMGVSGREVRLLKPVIYQETNGERREIAGNYEITGEHRVTFSIGNYDRNERLVIDPVLDYSTYLGGGPANQFGIDTAFGIAVDSNGDAYVAGQTFSASFPTNAKGYTQGPLGGGNPNGAVFVTELNPGGTSEVYSTYLIGTDTQGDYGLAIALDSTGKIYVTGQTFSTGFPVVNEAETAPANVATNGTAFLSKIDPTLSGASSLLYSTYLGGTGGDFADAVAADASGNAYVGGITYSSDFLTAQTTATGYQVANPDTADGVAFLVAVNTGGSGASSVTYSTYLGGDGKNAANSLGYGDQAYGVAADSSGNAYVVGVTSSSNFPTVNAYQTAPPTNTNAEAFVAQINTTPPKNGVNSLVYSTYLGGDVFDLGGAIALEPGNATPATAVYVTGATQSPHFPTTTGAYASAVGAHDVVFVTKLDMTPPGGAGSLKYSALVGGTGGDDGTGIAVDSSGNAYVAGGTASIDFPVVPSVGAYQTSDNNTGGGTAFLFELNPGGNGAADLLYSTYFGGGGPGSDTAWAIALDSGNNAYIAGQTGSTSNFPISPSTAFQKTMTQFDATAVSAGFVAKLTLEPTIVFSATTLAFGNDPVGTPLAACGLLSPCVVTLTNNTGAAIPITLETITATAPSVATDFAAGGAGTTCAGSVPAGGNCAIAVTFTPSVAIAETATLPIQYTAGNNGAATQNITLTGTGTAVANFTLTPAVLPAFPATLVNTTSAAQQVTLLNTSGAAQVFTITTSANFSETDSCAGPIGGGAMCTINVSFTPTATGSLNGTLTAASGGAMQQTKLSGAGGDFAVTSLPASVTVTNNSGNFGANVTTVPTPAPAGFAPSVSFVCATTIPNGTCTAATVTAPSPITVNISVAASVPPSSHRVDGQRLMRPAIPLVAALLLFLTLPLLRRRRAWLGLAGAVFALCVFSSCSGTNKAQNYSLTLTANSTNNGTTVSHQYMVPVVVK